jgi:hypothetical protein
VGLGRRVESVRVEVERYLHDLAKDHASGEAVAETSGYGALQNLLNAVGGELTPSVRAIVNIRNRGAGIPDGGLFTADQLRRSGGERNRFPVHEKRYGGRRCLLFTLVRGRGVLRSSPVRGSRKFAKDLVLVTFVVTLGRR